ncbi:MAG: FAD binding domain-containing protein [Rhodospirillales bacterium]|jgi:2-furoyl-CoA dehydrogenase FAD binding subunit|nr:carbon monoxide dehydrogenase [Rhodospirillaceae bacterium]MDP6427023.1 FAD binding domain-containing protein [Rhodospirillales bacterium]MDP6646614.1 FAD binding domain-containing protein [Rhodospirillales bacterium]MDP6841902.1 FAD binding domain-containing protein [Rhodospirillales bacterium]
MKPKPFDYVRAETEAEALDNLREAGEEARIFAGGQSLMPMMNLRLVEPGILVDISRTAEFAYIREAEGGLEIGAATTQAELQAWPGLADRLPLLDLAIPHLGHFQTRNRGTVCGSLAHADPSSELPLCLAVLDGEVVLRSARGERVLKAGDFQLGLMTTARTEDELIAAARYPLKRPGEGFAFDEVTRRRGDFAIVAAAAAALNGTVRLGIGGVADKPTLRVWTDLADADLDEELNNFAWDLGGYDDIHATARYRRELVRRLGRSVIEEAKACQN